ncbi:hypothetical protein G6F24_015468 [Rhizopus arrhizus]|nr:hypothetical protein G6F24_015468 [Rhizopus arrhizus]
MPSAPCRAMTSQPQDSSSCCIAAKASASLSTTSTRVPLRVLPALAGGSIRGATGAALRATLTENAEPG